MAATMADGMDSDSDTAGRWVSYAELAQSRGTDKHSALKLALRKRWPRRKDNHGTMQVCVPLEWLGEWTRKSEGMASGLAGDVAFPMGPARADGVDISGIISAFEAATASLTKRAEAAEARADAMQQERDEAHKRADVAVALANRTLAVQEAQVAAEALRRNLEAAEVAQAKAEANAAELRERHAQEIAVAEHDARAAQQAAAELRRADEARKARGRWARLTAAWRGE
jgi:hypothetical protein